MGATHGGRDRIGVQSPEGFDGGLHAVPSIGNLKAGLVQPIGAEVAEVGMCHEPQPRVAPSDAIGILHTRPSKVVVQREDVLAVGL